MIRKYDTNFDTDDPVAVELDCIRMGGKWTYGGQERGLGIVGHHKAFQKLILPEKRWHRWNELTLPYLADPYYKLVALAGRGGCGKTHEAACAVVAMWCAKPNETTVLVSSTDVRSLELRIWGEIKKVWSAARAVSDTVPGRLIASKQVILADTEDETADDWRNGIIGIPCTIGGTFVGLSRYVGVHNRYVILVADEASLMSDAYSKGINSLKQNPSFRIFALANPKDRYDVFGRLVEPADSEGGWAVAEDVTKTTVWKTRFERGVCINLVGTDSPNHDDPKNSFVEFMPSVESVEEDAAYYGTDSALFLMFTAGRFPKDSQSRRVITRALCAKFAAQEDVVWESGPSFKVVGIDAAYGAIGGDRTPLTELHVGRCHDGKQRAAVANVELIPVRASLPDLPEDQIALFTKKYCEDRGIPPSNVGFDSTGRGSLMSSFCRLWSTAIIGVEFGGVASDRPIFGGKTGPNPTDAARTCRQMYINFCTELAFLLNAIVIADQMRGLPTDVMDEAASRSWDFVGSGAMGTRIQVEPKSDLKLRLGRSPDLADSLAVGLELCRRLGLEVGGNTVRNNDLSKLMKEFQEQRKSMIQRRELQYHGS